MVYTHAKVNNDEEILLLRKECGRLIKHLREKSGLSQRKFAACFDNWHYTFVSQIENGRNRIPSDQIKTCADVLGLDARSFSLMIMRYYDPVIFRHIFENDPDIMNGTIFPDYVAFKNSDSKRI